MHLELGSATVPVAPVGVPPTVWGGGVFSPISGWRDAQGQDVACLLFGPASWKVAARDEFIGWSGWQRQSRLSHLANNSRFLILPWMQSPHLASHLLAQAVRRLRVDEQIRVSLECCPPCQGPVSGKQSLTQDIEGIPEVRPCVTEWVTEEGWCERCQSEVCSTHPLQVSRAGGADAPCFALRLGSLRSRAHALLESPRTQIQEEKVRKR